MKINNVLQIITSLNILLVYGDIYLHNPRGSNNRNCENGVNRQNANRLFDSQNNAKGGYACPRAYPFACYKFPDGSQEKDDCNALNTGLTDADAQAQALIDGTVKNSQAVNTPKMYYYVDSEIEIEWTVQHGSGDNAIVNSDTIIQISCGESAVGLESGAFSFTDDCGTPGSVCQPRDGTPISNSDTVNLETISDTTTAQADYRRGRHESYQYYQRCKNLERNKGLWFADQGPGGNDARFTRQNNGGTRYGFECPEESEYWPWWQPSPWVDIAIITSDMEACEKKVQESQNVKAIGYCVCSTTSCTGNGKLPIDEALCTSRGGTWNLMEPFSETLASKGVSGPSAPICVRGAYSRDNHLGNVGVLGQPYMFKWKVPEFLKGRENCVLRTRYNISTNDESFVTVIGNASLNGDASPIKDRNTNTEETYQNLEGLCDSNEDPDICQLSMATNTNQYGRTFQDRSFVFDIVERPSSSNCDNIYNLNVKGKRGNIVQVYPAVQYDFVPSSLSITAADCVHVQWTGSDYNPSRNNNDAEGGPRKPDDSASTQADRSNMVQIESLNANLPITDSSKFTMWNADVEIYRKLAFLDQDLTQCVAYKTLLTENGNRQGAESDHRNCMKLNGQTTPYFDAGLLKANVGSFTYMSTRNNNFSNRSQKATLEVGRAPLSPAEIAGIVLGSLIVSGVIVYAVFFFCKKKSPATEEQTTLWNPTTCEDMKDNIRVAGYDYSATEPGELSFRMGEIISILRTDESGWWEGRTADGHVGVFPSTYLKPIQYASESPPPVMYEIHEEDVPY